MRDLPAPTPSAQRALARMYAQRATGRANYRTPIVSSADKAERTGTIAEGNINLSMRPTVQVPGGLATVRSISFSDRPGVEILIPTIVNGKLVSDDEAIRNYYATGQYLGKYTSPKAANLAANRIHESEARRIGFK